MDKFTLDQDVMVNVDWSGKIANPTKAYTITYGIYPYQKNSITVPIDGTYSPNPIFVGQAHIPKGATSLDLHLNEILGAQRWTPDFLVKSLWNGKVSSTGTKLQNTDNWYAKFKVVASSIPEYGGLMYTTTFDSMEWATLDGKWTCGKKGYSHSNDGVQVTSSLTGAYTLSVLEYNRVTKVIVTYCTNTSTGAGSVDISVGATTQNQAITKSGGKTKREVVYDFSDTKPSGKIKLLVNCTTNSIYISGITIYYNSSSSATSVTYGETEVAVGLWYNYAGKNLTSSLYEIPDWDASSEKLYNCLDGRTDDSAVLLPRIPYCNTDYFGFGTVFLPSKGFCNTYGIPNNGNRYLNLGLENITKKTGDISFQLQYPNINYFYLPLSTIFSNTTMPTKDVRASVYLSNTTYKQEVAIVDLCPARYYLQWIDRTGGLQSQPFEGRAVFSEDFTNVQIQNSIGYKRNVNLQSTLKWTLNTTWLNEEHYPYYESIFTSPYLLLYDTQNDKSYNVIINDKGYTEKTRKNQRKLFNLTINVTANKTQKMYY